MREGSMQDGSVQTLSHFRSCGGGSVGFRFGRVERRHVHVLAGRPLGCGDVPEPGRGEVDASGNWPLLEVCDSLAALICVGAMDAGSARVLGH